MHPVILSICAFADRKRMSANPEEAELDKAPESVCGLM